VLLALTLERTVNAKGVVGTVGAVPEHAYPDACCFPGEVLRNSKHISSLLRGAERGQVKWTHPDLHPLMLPQSGLDAQSRRKKGDAAALRKRLVS